MKEKQKKHITHNPQPKTEIAKPTKLSRRRPALEVAIPVAASVPAAAPSTPPGATALVGTIPYRPGTGLASMAATSPPAPASSTPTTGTVAASASTTATPVVGVMSGPPDATMPTIPAGYAAPPKTELSGWRLTKGELSTMQAVIADLVVFEGDYQAVLGASAPDPAAIAAQASVGLRWRGMRDQSVTWSNFAVSADAVVWKSVLVALDQMKPLFTVAEARNANLAAKYPGLTAFFRAQKAPSKLAAATKKRRAKEDAAKAAAASAVTAEATPAEAQSTAAKGTTGS